MAKLTDGTFTRLPAVFLEKTRVMYSLLDLISIFRSLTSVLGGSKKPGAIHLAHFVTALIELQI
jgi:hypothetical protein